MNRREVDANRLSCLPFASGWLKVGGWVGGWKEEEVYLPVRWRASSATTSATKVLEWSTTSGSSRTCGGWVGGGWVVELFVENEGRVGDRKVEEKHADELL